MRKLPSAAVETTASLRATFDGRSTTVKLAPVTLVPPTMSLPSSDARVSKGCSPPTGVGSQFGIGVCVGPVAGSHPSVVQTLKSFVGTGAPPMQTPAPLHASGEACVPVHALLSLQAVPATAGDSTQPATGSHDAT